MQGLGAAGQGGSQRTPPPYFRADIVTEGQLHQLL
jgi:hypothetical protein